MVLDLLLSHQALVLLQYLPARQQTVLHPLSVILGLILIEINLKATTVLLGVQLVAVLQVVAMMRFSMKTTRL